MIKHILLFKIPDQSSAQMSKKMLLELPSKIDVIRSWEIGHAYPGAQGYELALVSTFDSKEDLKRYLVHPEHITVRDFVFAVSQDWVSCDYEI